MSVFGGHRYSWNAHTCGLISVFLQFFSSQATSTSQSKWPMLQHMLSSRISRKCSGLRISQHPVAVTKMLAFFAASSMVVTSKPTCIGYSQILCLNSLLQSPQITIHFKMLHELAHIQIYTYYWVCIHVPISTITIWVRLASWVTGTSPLCIIIRPGSQILASVCREQCKVCAIKVLLWRVLLHSWEIAWIHAPRFWLHNHNQGGRSGPLTSPTSPPPPSPHMNFPSIKFILQGLEMGAN